MFFGIIAILLIVGGSALFAALAVAMDNLGDKIIASMNGDNAVHGR